MRACGLSYSPLQFLNVYTYSGNVLSNDFMELPNKKIWAIYYKTISRPMSFEKIYVRHITTIGSDFDGPFLRNTLSGRSIRMLLNLRRTSSSCFPTQCNLTRIIPLSGRQPANSRCLPLFFSLLTGDELIKLPGIFCETDVRSPCFVRGTTIRFQRSTTPLKRED